VIGAGAIGVECAYFFNAFGTEVTIVEMLPNVLPVDGNGSLLVSVSSRVHRPVEVTPLAFHPDVSLVQAAAVIGKAREHRCNVGA
jgi:Pyridine nucleotide-disulphide oxidoreductase